ncbi:MAG: DUF3592 domain-containing protein [Lachnospiraceae bacterium]|nr:DUF3592 domain-containing protein [Lachnospiraceae bacterium]
MTATHIACIVLSSVGIMSIFLSMLFFMRERRIIKKCSAIAIGQVIDYRFRRGDNPFIAPIVEFDVDGKTYRAYRHYRGIGKRKIVATKETNVNDGFYISDSDWFFYEQKGRVFSFRAQAERDWPLGSTLKVLYNPNKPKQAFVEKIVLKSKVVGIVLLSVGAGLLVVAGVAFFLV